jgi:NAD(P)-dependent dehydrogenase (short-subunit alcohol dehydrogenase family)
MFKKGQVAIVTGIGPGMGRSIAVGFAQHGVDVAIAARRIPRVEAVADEIRALGREPLVFPLDITDGAGCKALVAATVERFGGVDFLVQNGHDEGDWSAAVDADLNRWRQVFEVNFFGALNLAQAAVPEIRKRGGGAIVFVNTGGAIKVPPGMGAYSASKSALASLTRTMALELGPSKIRVNGAYLGAIEGETVAAAAAKSAVAFGITTEEWYKQRNAESVLGGALPTPDQCAGTILYLCSDLAQAVTGVHVSVNNGQWIL